MMWNLSIPYWEVILRAGLVYLFMVFAMRFMGKRQIGELAPFEFVLLLLISNGVQNSMNGGDNTVTAGLIITVTLLALSAGLAKLAFFNKSAEKFIEGRPEILIHNGVLFVDVMTRNQLTHHEMNNILRDNGCLSVDDVRLAILETNGHINVLKKED